MKKLKMPQKIPIDSLRISFSEMFDSHYVPLPQDPSYYIVKVGDILFGFSEVAFLRHALDLVKKKYGDYISTSMIEAKKIPRLSEPIVRRHGSLKDAALIGKWIIYQDSTLTKPVVLTTVEDISHSDLVKNKLGFVSPEAKYVKGGFFYDATEDQYYIVVTDENEMKVDSYLNELLQFFENASFASPVAHRTLKIFKVSRRPQVKVVVVPLSERDKLYIEQRLPSAVDWEIITGDEYTNKNKNEPELWRPIRQTLYY